jgi:twitching motility protein PilT
MSVVKTAVIEPYLQEVWERKGTDLLFTATAPPLMRVDGELIPIPDVDPLEPAEVAKIVSSLLGKSLHDEFKLRKELDFSFNWGDEARFRGNAFLQRGTVALALRLIPLAIPTFDELGLPAVVERFVTLPQGLVLVTGPTGSGKSTTLASMLDYINEHRSCHILTIEDPIEYLHQHKRSAVNQREIGEDADSFYTALRRPSGRIPTCCWWGRCATPSRSRWR